MGVYLQEPSPIEFSDQQEGEEMDYRNIVKEVKIGSVEELFQLISPFGAYSNILDGFVFRGESSNSYKLLPSALRLENKEKLYALSGMKVPIDNQSEWSYCQVKAEYQCLRNFFINADNNGLKVPQVNRIRARFNERFGSFEIGFNNKEKWIPNDLHELAALAQHYGIPTRLIDWSYDSFIALYFAAVGALKKSNSDDCMVLWALNTYCLELLQPTVNRIPLVFVKPPYSDNPNLYAQQGVLSFWETSVETMHDTFYSIRNIERTPLDKLLCIEAEKNNLTEFNKEEFYLLYKFEIPIIESHKLLDALNKLKYTAARIFPGYDGITKYMTERSMIDYNLFRKP